MKRYTLALKLSSSALSMATAQGPVFAMLDPPGVVDAHGDTMDAGALELPPPGPDGTCEVPVYYLHSYHEDVVAEAAPSERVAIGVAVVWMEDGFPYFTPRFFKNTELSEETESRLNSGEISACSVGYLVASATPNGKGPNGSGEDVHKARLIEVSLVDKGAKEGAVRIKAMIPKEDVKKMLRLFQETREEVARLKTKAYGVEMMVGSHELYFATEMMKHLGEAIAACQTYLKQGPSEPGLAAIAKESATTLGGMLGQFATWLSSGAARGESAEVKEQEPTREGAAEGDAVTKWLNSLTAKAAQ
jgi:hypothetical protein